MRVNNLSKVSLYSPAAGIEPAISSHKSNALTTTPPNRTQSVYIKVRQTGRVFFGRMLAFETNLVGLL